MMTRILISFLALTVLFSGCNSVTFPEPMPMNRRDLPQFPKGWLGTWSDGENFTIQIHPDFVFDLKSDERIFTLPDEGVLRRFHGYLVLSLQQDDPEQWAVLLGRKWKNEIQVWGFEESDAAIAIWKEVLETGLIEETTDDILAKEKYELDPGDNIHFRRLLMRGGMSRVTTLRHVDSVETH